MHRIPTQLCCHERGASELSVWVWLRTKGKPCVWRLRDQNNTMSIALGISSINDEINSEYYADYIQVLFEIQQSRLHVSQTSRIELDYRLLTDQGWMEDTGIWWKHHENDPVKGELEHHVWMYRCDQERSMYILDFSFLEVLGPSSHVQYRLLYICFDASFI